MAHKATHRFAMIAPRKVRGIADLIRNKPVEEAISTLHFLPNRGAKMLKKLLETAVANAKDSGVRRLEDLVVVDARVDEGPRAKRIRPRARGMAFMIIKRMSHIHVAIDEK